VTGPMQTRGARESLLVAQLRAQREPSYKGIQTELPSNSDVSLTTLQARGPKLSA